MPGVTIPRAFASASRVLSKRWTAPRGMQSASPGPTSVGTPSIVQVSTPEPRIWNQALNYVENLQELYGKDNVEIEIVALGHGAHDLVMHQPGRRVAHAEVALERQGRQPGLGLADQVDRQEPGRQR